MRNRIASGLVATLVCISGAASAQTFFPTPPGQCIEPIGYDGHPTDFGWAGYWPHGYIEGLLVHVVHESRYSADWPEDDQDWNFVLRPLDKKECPDGKSIMGRDCKRNRELYVDLIWGTSNPEWRVQLLAVLNTNGDFEGLTAKEKAILASVGGFNGDYPADQVNAAIQKFGGPTLFGIGRKLWGSIVVDSKRFNRLYGQAGSRFDGVDYVLEGEVQTSTLSGEDEINDPNYRRMLEIADFENECWDDQFPQSPPNVCTITTALFFGTITTDLNHDEGKPEMHPIRAIVDARRNDATAVVATKVRALADFGKAGDNGSGGDAGRVCEHWLQNQFNTTPQKHAAFIYNPDGKYRSYVTVTPDAFEFAAPPKAPSPPAGSRVFKRECGWGTLIGMKWNADAEEGLLRIFPQAGTSAERCPEFTADPVYRTGDGGDQRLYGGFWIDEFVTRQVFDGIAVLTAKTSSDPVPLGPLTAGTLVDGVKLPVTARWWKAAVDSDAKLETQSGSKPVTVENLKWAASGAAFAVGHGQGANVYVPIAPNKGGSLARYKVVVEASGTVDKDRVASNKVVVSIPRPTVSTTATYGFEVKTAADGTKSLAYKPRFHAHATGLGEGATFAWMRGKTQIGDGADLAPTLGEPDADPEKGTKLSVVAMDAGAGGPYEQARAKVRVNLPQALVDVPDALVKRSGPSVKTKIDRVGATPIDCKSAIGSPATGYGEVTLTAKMWIARNPYKVPGAESPRFTWGQVQVQAGDVWNPVAQAKSSGTGGDTLTVTVDDVASTSDLAALRQFRVKLSAIDEYGRTATRLVHFSNWDAAAAVQAADECFDQKFYQLSKIAPDLGPDAASPTRDTVLLSRLSSFYQVHDRGELALAGPTTEGPPVDPSTLTKPTGAKLPVGADPKRESLGSAAIYNDIERLKTVAPALR